MTSFRILASIFALLLAAPAAADLDWQAHADVEVVDVLTNDEDGAPREHPIWLAVVDGAGFIRTGGSTWGQNVSRTGRLALRIGDTELALAADPVEDDALRERVEEVFRSKYGFQDRMVGWFRGDRPKIFQLRPLRRSQVGMAWDPALFVYGTLMVPDVLCLVVGREIDAEPAVLMDHVCRRLHGVVYPGLVVRQGERTEGLLLRGLSREELQRVDRFEGGLYQRLPCLVETEEGEAQAFVYVLRSEHGGLLGPEEWDVERFVRDELAPYLEGCRRFAEGAGS